MRISEFVALLAVGLLASCSETSSPETQVAGEAEGSERIPCARGSTALNSICTVERARTDQGLTLTVRHPDGAFRRLLVTGDGRGVVAADGAEPAEVSVTGADRIEVAIGGDRYRLPATVAEQASTR